MEHQKNISDLFHKLINNACSPEEVDHLLESVTSDKNSEEFKQLINDHLALPLASGEINDAVQQRLESRLEAILKEQKSVQKSRIKSLGFWYYAAAAVLIMMITSGVYFSLKKEVSKQVASKGAISEGSRNDILPGGNKAILTLANGSKIVLGSVNNGTLAHQGNASIVKLDSGAISYHSLENVSDQKPNKIFYNTIATPRGGQYQIVLPDGSKVWLNAESSLKFPASFSGKERNVELAGEGYFEIAKNPKMPFKVKVNNAVVEVLGTHFNVNAYADESIMRTTLLEGSVKVIANEKTQVLRPGEQLSMNKNEVDLLTDKVNTEQVLAWKNGLFDFSGLDLRSIAQQLSRWYQVNISFESNIPEKHISAIISKKNNISTVLKMLEFTAGIHSRIEGSKVIFYK